MLKLKTKTNPVFWPDRLAATFADRPDRLADARTNPRSVDFLTWNVFSALDTHDFPDRLAYRLQSFGGSGVRPPVRLALWVGRDQEPVLRPSPGYLEEIGRRATAAGGSAEALSAFAAPVEVDVLVETPEVLVLVDTTIDRLPLGNGGRDRLVELVDVGLDQARNLGSTLAVAVVYASGTRSATELSRRVNELRDPAALQAALPHRRNLPPVVLREVTWQSLLAAFEADLEYLHLDGQPVRRFLEHARSIGLRAH